ncbi:MAG: co-chaperone GroES [Planctomycetes bacterium]|jgi:chaperonin GroES|nr:co-chaperone GroES [Planctomycetota bacterium]MDP6424060.1 co-chaperone GroES [Planctomycetota bacterium]
MAKTKTPTIVPLGDRVLIQRVDAEDVTKGGIVLPDTAKEKPKEGIVVSTGKGKLMDDGKHAALTVKKNDRVIFSSYAGTEVKIEGGDYMIMSEDEILAVIG